MLNVYLLRHGQTEWNASGNRYCGRTDLPLTETGLRQARAVRDQLNGISFHAVYASPLQRAYHTAQIASGGREVIRDERLIEADFGNWEGKTMEEFIEEDAALWANWMNDPLTSRAGGTGETGKEIIERVDAFFQAAQQKHDASTILVVAHNGINRLYMAHKLGMPLRKYRSLVQENSSVTLFTLDETGELVLKLLNSKGVSR